MIRRVYLTLNRFVKIIFIIFIVCIMVLMQSTHAYAFEIRGDACGLTVTPSETYVASNNLNPGDVKTSYIVLSNQGRKETKVYMNTELVYEVLGSENNSIMEMLHIIIYYDDGRVLYEGSFVNLHNKPKFVGSFKPNESEKLIFTLSFASEAANEFKATSLFVKWIFTAQCGDLPKTGEQNPALYYSLGVILILIGVRINGRAVERNMRQKL